MKSSRAGRGPRATFTSAGDAGNTGRLECLIQLFSHLMLYLRRRILSFAPSGTWRYHQARDLEEENVKVGSLYHRRLQLQRSWSPTGHRRHPMVSQVIKNRVKGPSVSPPLLTHLQSTYRWMLRNLPSIAMPNHRILARLQPRDHPITPIKETTIRRADITLASFSSTYLLLGLPPPPTLLRQSRHHACFFLPLPASRPHPSTDLAMPSRVLAIPADLSPGETTGITREPEC